MDENDVFILFVLGFFVPLNYFSFIWDVAITGEGLQLFYLYSSLTAMEQRGRVLERANSL